MMFICVYSWSTDAVIDKTGFPSPHCVEIVSPGRVWKLCPISEGYYTIPDGNQTIKKKAKQPVQVLVRFMRLLETNLLKHKASFRRHRKVCTESDRQLVPRNHNAEAETGRGMTPWERISGNVPSPYISYDEIKLIRLVSTQAVEEPSVADLGAREVSSVNLSNIPDTNLCEEYSDSDDDSSVNSIEARQKLGLHVQEFGTPNET